MRKANITRNTKETKITLSLDLDGTGVNQIDTKIGFFDHMLCQIAVHGLIDLNIKCDGDINVDAHHSIEDTGIVLGQAIKEALNENKGINRYGKAIIPMDEALIMCAIDIANRPYAEIDTPFTVDMVGEFPVEMTQEFFKAVAYNSGLNIQIIVLRGVNNHHIIEGMFKAFARALMDAITPNPRFSGVTSSKGML